MAKQMFHSLSMLWPIKECNAFMAKYLQLLPKQKKEYEANLQKEDFLKDYEKVLGLQAAFEYIQKCKPWPRA